MSSGLGAAALGLLPIDDGDLVVLRHVECLCLCRLDAAYNRDALAPRKDAGDRIAVVVDKEIELLDLMGDRYVLKLWIRNAFSR